MNETSRRADSPSQVYTRVHLDRTRSCQTEGGGVRDAPEVLPRR